MLLQFPRCSAAAEPVDDAAWFWTMRAHWHGQLWNASRLAQSMGVSAPAIRRYLDALAGAYMLRCLEPMEAKVMKRLVKSPKAYVRDSGLLLSLLDVRSLQQLSGHPVAGALWEGVVIEQLIGAKPPAVQANFYRTVKWRRGRPGLAQPPRPGGDRVQVFQQPEARARIS